MSRLLSAPVYGLRDHDLFLQEMNDITLHHMNGCEEFSRMWKNWKPAASIEDIPFVHSGVFKQLDLKTRGKDKERKRIVQSSSTSGVSSKIYLDTLSSRFQSDSSTKILRDFLGENKLPLIVIDSASSLTRRTGLTARILAAMSLQPLASEINFILEDPDRSESVKWELLEQLLCKHNEFIVYGFSWILWLVWAATVRKRLDALLRGKTIFFIHSGGWKKLEAVKVDRKEFDGELLKGMSGSSKVVDFYGLVEQMGVIYPMCEEGYRHVPVWADVLIRDIYTLASLASEIGQIQLMNCITYGGPNYSVLTEDVGRLIPGECSCGRKGKRFELIGRLPNAEIRGCSNV
jgi:hypothetical protein